MIDVKCVVTSCLRDLDLPEDGARCQARWRLCSWKDHQAHSKEKVPLASQTLGSGGTEGWQMWEAGKVQWIGMHAHVQAVPVLQFRDYTRVHTFKHTIQFLGWVFCLFLGLGFRKFQVTFLVLNVKLHGEGIKVGGRLSGKLTDAWSPGGGAVSGGFFFFLASLENVLTYLYLEPLWSMHVCVLEPLWSMHLLICSCSSFDVCNYLFEVSCSTDQIMRLIFRCFSDCETSTYQWLQMRRFCRSTLVLLHIRLGSSVRTLFCSNLECLELS